MEVIALGALGFSSIALGILALDEMVKIAPVRIIEARTMCPVHEGLLENSNVRSDSA